MKLWKLSTGNPAVLAIAIAVAAALLAIPAFYFLALPAQFTLLSRVLPAENVIFYGKAQDQAAWTTMKQMAERSWQLPPIKEWEPTAALMEIAVVNTQTGSRAWGVREHRVVHGSIMEFVDVSSSPIPSIEKDDRTQKPLSSIDGTQTKDPMMNMVMFIPRLLTGATFSTLDRLTLAALGDAGYVTTTWKDSKAEISVWWAQEQSAASQPYGAVSMPTDAPCSIQGISRESLSAFDAQLRTTDAPLADGLKGIVQQWWTTELGTNATALLPLLTKNAVISFYSNSFRIAGSLPSSGFTIMNQAAHELYPSEVRSIPLSEDATRTDIVPGQASSAQELNGWSVRTAMKLIGAEKSGNYILTGSAAYLFPQTTSAGNVSAQGSCDLVWARSFIEENIPFLLTDETHVLIPASYVLQDQTVVWSLKNGPGVSTLTLSTRSSGPEPQEALSSAQ